MGNLISSFGQGSTPTTPPPTTPSSRRRRGRKRGVEEGEGGDAEEVEELSPRRSGLVVGSATTHSSPSNLDTL